MIMRVSQFSSSPFPKAHSFTAVTPSSAAEQQLRKLSWREHKIPGKGGVVFWGILALVVVVLLVVISRLLAKSPPPA